MQFSEVSEEEMANLQFAGSRARSGNNPYGELLEAVKSGKTLKVPLEAGKQMKNLKWGLSQAAKKAGITLTIKVLADQSGVVVSDANVAKTPSGAEEIPPEASATGKGSRK